MITGVSGPETRCTIRDVVLGGASRVAAGEARYFDLSVFPWVQDPAAVQDLAQAVVFESGRPAILVPPPAKPEAVDHVAIAWDGSRVAARALGDALPFLAEGGRVTVLTVRDEKKLSGEGLADALASALQKRGIDARPLEMSLGKRSISDALQDAAMKEGAKLLAMGGFGHSRIRDFVLGGATQGVLAKLQIPTLLSH
jgi:nucleotide-binding universal stress UspA family protein